LFLLQHPVLLTFISSNWHCAISLTDGFLVVERDATEEDEPYNLKLHVSDLTAKHRGAVITIPHGKVRIEVFCDTKSFFVICSMGA
jgi:hypothetical protein